jgi:hypothetical protein
MKERRHFGSVGVCYSRKVTEMDICKHQKETVLLLMWSLVKTLFCACVCFCEAESYVFFQRTNYFLCTKYAVFFMHSALCSTFLYSGTQDTPSYTNSVRFC